MLTFRKRSPLLALGMLLLLLSACASTGSGTTAADALSKSAQAMQKLTSANFALNLSLTTNLGGRLPSGNDSTANQSTAGSDLSVTAKGNGQALLPDQSAFTLQLHAPTAGQNQDTQISTVLKDKKIYYKGNDGQWYVTGQKNTGDISSILSDTQIANYNQLLTLGDKAKLTDHGVESRNGENLRHLTLTFDKAGLNDVLNKLGLSSSQQQLLTQFMNMLTIKTLSFDTWIDEATSYVHHMDFALDVSANLSNLSTALAQNNTSEKPSPLSSLPSTVNLKLSVGIDLSKFNQPVTITAPANAIPATNISKIFAH